MESVLGELINQKIISNKKTSSSCNSFYRAEKSDNNSNILENSSKNQANLDAIQISLKDPVPRVNIETRQSKHVIQNKNKPEEEINALKFEAQLSALKSYMNWELSTMNNKLDAFSQCLIKNASCQSNNENKNFETLQDNVKFLQKELAGKNDLIKSLMETQTAILEFVSSVRKNVNESGEFHQEQARLYQQKYSPLLRSSQQQQQQASNIHQHQTMSQTNRKCLEQQLNPSAIDFQIQKQHSFISPKNSFRRELRNSKESVNFGSESKFQSLYSLYCIDESETENEFSTLPEDTNFCRNQLVILKSARRPQVVVNNHPEKQTVFAKKKVVPGKASYAATITIGRKQTKKVNTIIFGDSIPKGIRHREFNQMLENVSAQFKIFLVCNSKELYHYLDPTLEN